MAVGWTFTEDMQTENGRELNPYLLDHKVCTAVYMPAITLEAVDAIDPEGPFGAKESGEGTVSPTAPAIANAVYNATGCWVESLPLTPEKVLESLQRKKQGANVTLVIDEE